MRREDIHNAVNGLRRVGRVQRRENEMPRLCECESGGNGFEIPHFSHHDDVRILPEHSPECLRERVEVLPVLPLPDDALAFGEEKFYGIFHSHNVLSTCLIDALDHGGERGAFPCSRRTCEEDEPLLEETEISYLLRETDIFRSGNTLGNETSDQTRERPFVVAVHTETCAVFECVGDIDFTLLLKFPELLLSQDLLHHSLHLRPRELRFPLSSEFSVDAEKHRRTDGQVHIGSACLARGSEDGVRVR